MRKYEKRIETEEREILIETTCDLCGAIAGSGRWESSSYNVNEVEIEVTVRQKEGNSCQEGGSGTDYTVDMCPVCFKEKLVPWLESQGCKTQRKDWDCRLQRIVSRCKNFNGGFKKMNNDAWKHRSSKMVCAACMWFVAKAKAEQSENTAPIGRCRRHAPTMNGYPVVFETDWCGDHKLDENCI